MPMYRWLPLASTQWPRLASAGRPRTSHVRLVLPTTWRNHASKTATTTDVTKKPSRTRSPAKNPPPASPPPSALKLSALQSLARTTGLSPAGPKPALITRLQSALQSHTPLPPTARVLSIDLGIRNLAYALLSPSRPVPTVHAWTRLDLATLTPTADTATQQQQQQQQPFSPPALAATALALVRSRLLPLRPTHVLVERQRFRSGGAAAVLEWTVRVNSLESMLYAVLAALAAEGRFGGVVVPVDPRRVAGMFLAGEEEEEEEDKRGGGGGAKEGKRRKIALVGGWLRDGEGVRVEGQAERLRSAFLARWAPGPKGRRARPAVEGDEVVPKLDDVADCLLQGVAWMRWEENKARLAEEYGHWLE